MKRAVRFLVSLLTVALLAAVLTGCTAEPVVSGTSGSTIPEEVAKVIPAGKYDFGGATVVIASPYEMHLDDGSSQSERLNSHIRALKENWNVNVEFKLIDADAYWTGMTTGILGNTAFGDLCIGSTIYLPDWIGAGAVRDVSGLAKEVGIDFTDASWDPAVYEENTYGNATYSFAHGVTEMWFGCLYNKKTLAAANLTDPNELIENGGVWSMKTFAEYARAMTVIGSDGYTEVYGAAFTNWDVMLWGCIAGAGGSLATYAEDGTATVSIGSPEALEGMGTYYEMLVTDQSTAYIGYENAMKMLPSGEIGMLLCEEWIAEYVRDYALENGFENDWALTYFPRGDEQATYIDPTPGAVGYFVPSCLSDEAAKRALIVYDALFSYDHGENAEIAMKKRAEELFSDEMSAKRYTEIVLGRRASYQACRLNLFYPFTQLAYDLADNLGTPQSLVGSYVTEMNAALDSSAYMQVLRAQQNANK